MTKTAKTLPNLTLEAALAEAEQQYVARNRRSFEHWTEACSVQPGGTTRSVLFYKPFPLTMARGEAGYLWDVDGHRYVDLLNDYSAGLYGHSNLVIQDAVIRAVRDGLTIGARNIYEARLADLVCSRFPAIDSVRFTNSGTEASFLAIAAARALTGRPKVLVFDRGYHGGFFVFKPGSTPMNAPFEWLIGRYNDMEATGALIERHGPELAAIMVEPMMGAAGCLPGGAEFLAALREAATRCGALLVFDEVMTSRLGPGGMQARLGIAPDLTVLGKYIGGGMNFGALGGRKDLMSRFDPSLPDSFSTAGTFNNNVVTMAAGVAGLEQVFTPEAAHALNKTGDSLRDGLNRLAREFDVPMQVMGVGSLMNVHFLAGSIRHPEELDRASRPALALFHLEMLARGYHLARRGLIALSLPLTDADLQGFLDAVRDYLETRSAALQSLVR